MPTYGSSRHQVVRVRIKYDGSMADGRRGPVGTHLVGAEGNVGAVKEVRGSSALPIHGSSPVAVCPISHRFLPAPSFISRPRAPQEPPSLPPRGPWHWRGKRCGPSGDDDLSRGGVATMGRQGVRDAGILTRYAYEIETPPDVALGFQRAWKGWVCG
jgi:hypothetical protein